MAKLIGPLHSTEARGVIGGLVYNTWRGVRYVKRMTSPSQPRTQKQLRIRSFSINLVRYWQSLDAITQGYWNDFAAAHTVIDWTGVSKRLTGANWFVGLNLRLLDSGIALVETPPIVAAPDALMLFAAADGVGQSSISWTAIASTLFAEIWIDGPHSPGRQGKIERARLLKRDDGDVPPYVATDLLPGTYTFFGRAMSTVDGQISTWVSDIATVSAA